MERTWTNARLATMVGDGLGVVDDGVVVSRNGRSVYAGPRAVAPETTGETIDCAGRWITPGLVDCHTHLVHAGARSSEWAQRLEGASYEDIARAGGGIVSTMRAPRAARRVALRGRDDDRDQIGIRSDRRGRAQDVARGACSR